MEYVHATFVKSMSKTPLHKQKVATPVYLEMQVPTYQAEVKLYYMFQWSVLRTDNLLINRSSCSWIHQESRCPRQIN
jgi:hypothetical protein